MCRAKVGKVDNLIMAVDPKGLFGFERGRDRSVARNSYMYIIPAKY